MSGLSNYSEVYLMQLSALRSICCMGLQSEIVRGLRIAKLGRV